MQFKTLFSNLTHLPHLQSYTSISNFFRAVFSLRIFLLSEFLSPRSPKLLFLAVYVSSQSGRWNSKSTSQTKTCAFKSMRQGHRQRRSPNTTPPRGQCLTSTLRNMKAASVSLTLPWSKLQVNTFSQREIAESGKIVGKEMKTNVTRGRKKWRARAES